MTMLKIKQPLQLQILQTLRIANEANYLLEERMTRWISKPILGFLLVVAILGCSRGKMQDEATLNTIQKKIETYDAQFAKQGKKHPAEAIVRRAQVKGQSVGDAGPADTYWIFRNGSFSEMAYTAFQEYVKAHERFLGVSGDYYYFEFFWFKDTSTPDMGVLKLPDGQTATLSR